jgi:hypothetical protein
VSEIKETIPSVKTGKQVKIEAGYIIVTETPKAKSPLLVYERTVSNIGPETLIEFRVADKDHVSLSRSYTAYQLERYGYKIAGKAKKMPKIKPPVLKPTVSLVEVKYGPGTGSFTPVITSGAVQEELPAAITPEKGLTPDGDKLTHPEPEQARIGDPGAISDDHKDDPPTLDDIMPVLDAWAYGVEPNNMDDLKAQLKAWGIDLAKVAEAIDGVLNKAAMQAIKKSKESQ